MRRRKCKQCGKPYTPQRPTQRVCGDVGCALGEGRALQEKADREALRQRREALRGLGWWKKAAQREFNAFIRLRDSHLPCVSCGRFHEGQYHAGHYRTTAAQPALRFNELNCHRQCAPCNNHKSGNITDYRAELVRRIGEEYVEWLERDFPPKKWTVKELAAIRDYYKNARKAMMTTPGECEPF